MTSKNLYYDSKTVENYIDGVIESKLVSTNIKNDITKEADYTEGRFGKRKAFVSKTRKSLEDDPFSKFQKKIEESKKLETDSTKDRRAAMKEINTLLNSLPKYEVYKTQIGPMKSEDIRKKSVCNINNMSKDNGTTHGLFDSRMGSIKYREICITCHRDDQGCGGHMGHINLPEKFVNCMFKDEIIWSLQCTCAYCGDTFIDEDIYYALGLDKVPKKKLLKVCAEISVKWLWQFHNHGIAKVVYDNSFKGSNLLFHFETDDLPVKKIMSTNMMMKIFEGVPDEKYKYIGFTGDTRPIHFITDVIACCPPHIRPPSIVNGKAMDHPITERYINILKCISKLNNNVKKDSDRDGVIETLYELIESITFGPEKKKGTNVPLKESGILPGLGTKRGVIRGNMSGKRVDKCGRTPAGPGFELNLGEVMIPKRHATKILMVPVTVHRYNYHKVIKHYKNGLYKYMIMKLLSDKGVFPITSEHINSYSPEIGDIFLRYMQPGDRILTGRQPSLHAESILAFNSVFNEWDTIKIHQSNNHCFNADFDGDELTFHVIQDVMAMAECDTIMNFKYHIMNQQSNKPMVALAFHGLIGSFLMTTWWMIDGKKTEVTIPPERFRQALDLLPQSYRQSSLRDRLLKHNIPLFSGRALFSVCLPTNFTYSGGNIEIIDGILVKGRLRKGNVGLKVLSLVQIICKMYSIKEACRFINDANKIADWFTMWHGLSIGYKDFNANRKEVVKMLKKDLNKMQIELYSLGPKPTDEIPLFFWMRSLHGIVDKTKINGKNIGENYLKINNTLNILSDDLGCGAKGSLSNTSQITGSLGEQLVGANIPQRKLKGKTRCLPFFPSDDVSLASYGYVFRSYMDSISPIDSMFHEMASRITLIDTARNVSEIGYQHRRLVKSLETVVISWLGMVTSTDGRLFQPMFGAGFDVGCSIPVKNKSFGEKIYFANFKDQANLLNRIHENKIYGNAVIPKHEFHRDNIYQVFHNKNGRFPKFSEIIDE